MNFLEQIKLIAEVITSIAAAFILLKKVCNLYNPMRIFLKTTVHTFFKGDTDTNGKKTRFFKALNQKRERENNIKNAILGNVEAEDVLVLDKEKLLDIISASDVFYKVRLRKNSNA